MDRNDAHQFVPRDVEMSDPAAIEPLVRELLTRAIASDADADRWLIDRSDLDAATSEAEATRYIAMTRHTDDPGAAGEYARFVERTAPRLRRWAHELDRRQALLRERFRPDDARLRVLDRDVRNSLSLHRDENIPIEISLLSLSQEYERILGAMTVEFQGEDRTFPEIAAFLERPDRAVREAAWRAMTGRRLQDAAALEDLFDRMVSLRSRMAANAGAGSFIEHSFRLKRRFDYTPEDCLRFHDACERVVTPALRAIDGRRRDALGLPSLRPWDAAVDPRGRAPLQPFEGGADLVARTQRVFDRLDPRLGAMFGSLREGDCLDLDSRPGKAPGGYQYMRDRSRRPFIFMNAAGLQRDVHTMVHEAGHAFHSLLTNDEPLVHYRHTCYEFAEVASMSMELLTMPYWDEYYPDASDLARARRAQLEGVVALLPWVATIDAFQHEIYSGRAPDRAGRERAWRDLDRRFGRAVSWEGLDEAMITSWHRQPHIFTSPFYYIEYGVAQLGALQLWLISKERGEREALDGYVRALSLGGARTLPELFEAAGLVFDFGETTLRRLLAAVEDELSRLPD